MTTKELTTPQEKFREFLHTLDAADTNSAERTQGSNTSKATDLAQFLEVTAQALASESSLRSVASLGDEGIVLLVNELLKALCSMLAACDGLNRVLPDSVSKTLVDQLQTAIQNLKAHTNGDKNEIEELESSIQQIVEENKRMEELLEQRIREVEVLFEKNRERKALLDVYSNVNASVAKSLPGRFQRLATKLSQIELELQEVDDGLRSAIEDHQKARLLMQEG